MALRRTLTALTGLSAAAIVTIGAVSCAAAEPEAIPVKQSLSQHELLIGKWKAAPPANQEAFVDFSEDGLYLASDGCNQIGGGWALDTDGRLTVSGGGMTQVGCNNEPIPDYILSSTKTTIDGNILTMVDRDGTQKKLHRFGDSELNIAGTWAGSHEETIGAKVTFSPDGDWKGSIGCLEYSGRWELSFQPEDMTQEFTDDLGSPASMTISKGSPLLVTGPEPVTIEQSCTTTGPSVAPVFPIWNAATYQVYLSPDHLNLVVMSPAQSDFRAFVFERTLGVV